jgi:hypothetical protein
VGITETPGSVVAAYEFTLEPNPLREEILLKFDWPMTYQDSAYVDQVVIDTWCIPEPVTLAFVGLGGIWLLRWRRR